MTQLKAGKLAQYRDKSMSTHRQKNPILKIDNLCMCVFLFQFCLWSAVGKKLLETSSPVFNETILCPVISKAKYIAFSLRNLTHSPQSPNHREADSFEKLASMTMVSFCNLSEKVSTQALSVCT